MAPVTSFAPLAARLAAHAAALRPAQRGRDGLGAAVMALVWGLLLEYLIWTCERLDARAAAELSGAVAAPALRDADASTTPAPRAARQVFLGEQRARWLTLALDSQATTPDQADVPSGVTGRPPLTAPRLVWSRDPGPIRAVLAPPWRPLRETRVFGLPISTTILLRYRN